GGKGGAQMALNSYEVLTIQRIIQLSRLIVEQLKPGLDNVNEVYNAVGGIKDTIPAEDLGQDALYGGMTKQQLDDAAYALTTTMKGAVDSVQATLQGIAYRQ